VTALPKPRTGGAGSRKGTRGQGGGGAGQYRFESGPNIKLPDTGDSRAVAYKRWTDCWKNQWWNEQRVAARLDPYVSLGTPERPAEVWWQAPRTFYCVVQCLEG